MSMNAIESPASAQLKLEDARIPRERFVDVVDLECDVVDPNQAWHRQIGTVARYGHIAVVVEF